MIPANLKNICGHTLPLHADVALKQNVKKDIKISYQ